MNASKLSLTVTLLFLTASIGWSQQLQPRTQTQASNDARATTAHQAASQAIAAFRNADYKGYVAMLHPAVIKDMGGRDKMIAITTQGKVTLDEQTDGYDTAVRRPNRIIQGAENIFAFVPQTVTLQLKTKQTINRESYLLGVSADNGRSWKFIDGGTAAAKIRELVPDFPANERLPNERRK